MPTWVYRERDESHGWSALTNRKKGEWTVRMQCDERYDRSPQGSEKVTPEHSLDWREGFRWDNGGRRESSGRK